MRDHSLEPAMPRVLVLPVPDKPGCYVCISGGLHERHARGERWYAGHEENRWQFDHRPHTEVRLSFTYVEDGIAAEWDGEHGPIQLWFKSHEGFKDGFDEARPHWLWPFAFGAGHWSQQAVERADLTGAFNRGDYDRIFGELRAWVRDRLSERREAEQPAPARDNDTRTE